MYSQQSQRFPVRIQHSKKTIPCDRMPQNTRSRKRRTSRGLTKPVTALVLVLVMISTVILTANIFDRDTDTGTKTDMKLTASAIEATASPNAFRPKYQNRKTVYSSGNALFGKYENALCVNITIHGEDSFTVYSTDDTVQELLDSLNLTLGENDELDCKKDDRIADGMNIKIDTVKNVIRIDEQIISAENKFIENDKLPKGTERTKTAAVDGKKTVTYSDRYVNGELESSKVVSEEITLKPVDGIIEKGTAVIEEKPQNESDISVSASNAPSQSGSSSGGVFTDSNGNTYTYSKCIDVEATAYGDADGTAITATGETVRYGLVAVDPKVIPYGTRMYVTGSYGDMGVMVAADCGNFKGNVIDIYLGTDINEIRQFGRRQMKVYILD